jgi:hypothetical protein
MPSYKQGTTYYIAVSSFPEDSSNLGRFYWTFRSTAAVSPANPDTEGAAFMFFATSTGRMFLQQIVTSGEGGFAGSATPTADWAVPATITLWLSTSNYNLSVGGTSVKSGTHTFTGDDKFVYLGYLNGTAGSRSLKLDNFGVTPQTATYTAQLLTIGNLITAWSNATISDVKTDGAIVYTFGSTSAATVASISNYASIITGGVPSVSTNPYAAFKAVFSNTAATSTVKLSEFITTWNEGSAAPSPVSAVYDRRYWLSFTTSTLSNPTQDTVLVWQRNKSFTFLKGINAASFSKPLWRDALYFGNSSANGLVYKFDVGNNDDGADIVSLLHSKSYDLGSSYRDKDFRNSYLQFLSSPTYSGSFSCSYTVDRADAEYSLGTVSMNEGNGLTSIKFPFPFQNPVQGREIQYRISKSGTGERLRLYTIALKFSVSEED